MTFFNLISFRGPISISRYMEKLACEYVVEEDNGDEASSLTTPEDADFWKQVKRELKCQS